MTACIQEKRISVQLLAQEWENVLSVDFENMSLDELKLQERKFCALAGSKIHRSYIESNPSQTKARDFLWFMLAKRENESDSVKVGDIFHSSWGYEQTNTEFYKVVEISKTGKTANVIQVGSVSVGDENQINHDMACTVVPDPDTVIDSRVQRVKIERSSYFHPYKQKHIEVGAINLRGTVFMSKNDTSGHLANLYRVEGECYRSWYA